MSCASPNFPGSLSLSLSFNSFLLVSKLERAFGSKIEVSTKILRTGKVSVKLGAALKILFKLPESFEEAQDKQCARWNLMVVLDILPLDFLHCLILSKLSTRNFQELA